MLLASLLVFHQTSMDFLIGVVQLESEHRVLEGAQRFLDAVRRRRLGGGDRLGDRIGPCMEDARGTFSVLVARAFGHVAHDRGQSVLERLETDLEKILLAFLHLSFLQSHCPGPLPGSPRDFPWLSEKSR